jgi:hypothetical protein
MPLALHDPRCDTVIQFLRMQSRAASLEQIRDRFTPRMPERTAQRLLASLMSIGAVMTTGGSRTRRYQLRTKPGPLGSVVWFPADSAGGEMIRAEIPAPTPPAQVHRTPKPARASAPPVDPGAATPKVGLGLRSPPSGDASIRSTPPSSGPSDPRVNRSTDTPAISPSGQPVNRSTGTPARTALPQEFAQLFASKLAQIIADRDDRRSAELDLQSAGAIEGLTPPEMETFLPAALAQLDTLTAEDAARYHVTPAQYAAWRAVYPASAS